MDLSVRTAGTWTRPGLTAPLNLNPSLCTGQLAERAIRSLEDKVSFMKKRFSIERRNLSAYSITELQGMAHFVHTADELVAEANISAWYEPLVDLEEAMDDELSTISRALQRVGKRLAGELARRKPSKPG